MPLLPFVFFSDMSWGFEMTSTSDCSVEWWSRACDGERKVRRVTNVSVFDSDIMVLALLLGWTFDDMLMI